jgi:Domain of unknown function (DUF4397)
MKGRHMSVAWVGQRLDRRILLQVLGTGTVAALATSRLAGSAVAQTTSPARVMVLHASPELGKIELHLNGDEVLDEFEYGMVSDWIEVEPGTVNLVISRDRAGINYTALEVIVPVIANQDYDLVIADPLQSEPILIPAPIDRSALPATTSRVGVIHASVALPALDIAQVGGDVLVENLSYGQLSAPLELPAGGYDLEARVHDTGQAVFTLPHLEAASDTIYTLVIHGLPDSSDTPLSVTTMTDTVLAENGSATPVTGG